MTTKIPVELSSTPSIVDNGGSGSLTVDVAQNIILDHDSGHSLVLQGSGTSYGSFFLNNSTNLTIATAISNGEIEFFANGSERMRIDSSGNIGIGTTSPAVELHINDTGGLSRIRLEGSASAADNFEFGQGTTGVTNGGFEIRDVDAATTRFVIDSSGNIGIGTTSPASKLHIFDGGSSVNNQITFGNPSAAHNAIIHHTAAGSEFLNIECKGTTSGFGNIVFKTGGTPDERMRIDSSGNVFLGKTGHDFDATGFELFPSTGYMNITRNQGTQLYLHRMNNDGAFVEFWQTNNLEGFIQVASGTVSLQNYSDYRMKKNVSDLGSCIDRVKALRPITFEYDRHAGYTHEGFIAHEVQEVLPQAVQGDKDAVDENGDPVYQSYDKSLLIPLLTKAIQEQQAIIEDLQTQINEVKNGN